tara:strand:+ start:242 stop:601 length:360 start_codon:yes stop_codon:yes gene_type:complete
MLNPEYYAVDVEMDSLTDNYYASNVVLEPLGFYGDLVSVTIDTSSLYISVQFSGYLNEYLILNVLSDTTDGGTTYLTQSPSTSNYGMVFVLDDSYMVFEQYNDSFTKFNGIIASELSGE